MASYLDLVTQVVRDALEPLTLDEIVRRVGQQRPVRSANPKTTIRNAVNTSQSVESPGDGRYAYVPRALMGSSFRIPLDNSNLIGSRLAIGAEVAACLRAAGPKPFVRERTVVFALAGGGLAKARYEGFGFDLGASASLHLTGALQTWLAGQRQAGADALVLRCRDGESGDFSLEGIRLADIDHVALAERNEQVLAVARDILRRNRVYLRDFALRLVVRGAYHGEPQPDPLPHILYELDGRFVPDASGITFRADLTPALRRVFAERLRFLQESELSPLELFLGRTVEEEGAVEEGELPLLEEPAGPRQPAQHLHRLRVRLRWQPSVWRVIEILDNQSLDDLHEAIQDAFGWDRDHLCAFFLSGKAWDQVTEVAIPPGPFTPSADTTSPYADELPFADLELRPGQRFLYLFDFGDDLRHDVEVLETLPAPASGDFPRVVEVHGKAPPQYPVWDDEAEAFEEADEDAEEE